MNYLYQNKTELLSKIFKYKNKYLNLKKLTGGNFYDIKDKNLSYYHAKHVELNSSITIYGEKHEENYTNFLERFIDFIYSPDTTGRKQVIIVECNSSEFPTEDQYTETDKLFKLFMLEGEGNEVNIERKKLGLQGANSPVHYFKNCLRFNGIFPNSIIICGDNRMRDIYESIIQLDEISITSPDSIIDKDFLTEYKTRWRKQLSVLN